MIAHLKLLVIDLEARQGDKAEEMLNINKNDLYEILLEYDIDDNECYPMPREKFVDYIFSLYRERLNPGDATSVYDSPTPDYKENQGDAEKSASAKCTICDFPKKGINQRIYCMCGQ